MHWKAAFTLLLVLFAPAVTLVALGSSLPSPCKLGITQSAVIGSSFDPLGDPVEGPGYPG